MKTPAVILEGVSCKALYSGQRMFCPRSIHCWWREIWLERVSIDACPRTRLSSIQTDACATADKAASMPAVSPSQGATVETKAESEPSMVRNDRASEQVQ